MLCNNLQSLEKSFFRRLNRYLEPLIRMGAGSPHLIPIGTIVLETTGRKSGRLYRTPVLASEFDNLLLISTVRSRSQWLKNLAATPQTQVWLRGQSLPVTAFVVDPNADPVELPPVSSPLVDSLIRRLKSLSDLTGAGFAILEKQAQPLSSRESVVLQA